MTRRAAGLQADLAFLLYERLPGVWEALHEGLIDLPRARVLSDLTMPLPGTWLDRCVIPPWNVLLGLTTGQLRAHLGGSSSRSIRLRLRNGMSRSWKSGECSPNRVRTAPPI